MLNGNENWTDEEWDQWAQFYGYENHAEYLKAKEEAYYDELAREAGYEDFEDYQQQYYDELAREQGYEDYEDY